jgi:uncharacterized repeat protein (TIGR04042 family)
MPEMHFRVRWPDGTSESCYSPSLVIKDYFQEGGAYPVPDFLDRSRTALGIASERVRAKYGFACTSAAAQLARIEDAALTFAGLADAHVVVEAFEE